MHLVRLGLHIRPAHRWLPGGGDWQHKIAGRNNGSKANGVRGKGSDQGKQGNQEAWQK